MLLAAAALALLFFALRLAAKPLLVTLPFVLLLNIAEILLRKRRPLEALAEYRKTLASLPNLAPARARIAEILRRQGGQVEP